MVGLGPRRPPSRKGMLELFEYYVTCLQIQSHESLESKWIYYHSPLYVNNFKHKRTRPKNKS